MKRPVTLKCVFVALVGALLMSVLLAEANASPPTEPTSVEPNEVTIQFRIWQLIAEPEVLWVSARAPGDRWDVFGTVRLPLRMVGAYEEEHRSLVAEVTMADINLRIWQRKVEPLRLWIQACPSTCQPHAWAIAGWHWRPLGRYEVPLDDGFSSSGSYRFGDAAITVPRDNTELYRDREHLLALRDVLRADPPLNWNTATPTITWEGVTVAGSPARVTAIDLTKRSLTGEIWGYLGDLTELRHLLLSGNALSGMAPSKLHLLTQLQHLELADNRFEGCLPPGLWRAEFHDLDSVGLPACDSPNIAHPVGPSRCVTVACRIATYGLPGTNYASFDVFGNDSSEPQVLVFDVPPGERVRIEDWFSAYPFGEQADDWEPETVFDDVMGRLGMLRESDLDPAYIFVDYDLNEIIRRSYSGCIYNCTDALSPAAWQERLAASFWKHNLVEVSGQDYCSYVGSPPCELPEWIWP